MRNAVKEPRERERESREYIIMLNKMSKNNYYYYNKEGLGSGTGRGERYRGDNADRGS